MMKINYRVINEGSEALSADLETIYRDVGWWAEEFDREWLSVIPRNSAVFMVAEHEGCVIGMGRALSDNISEAYIQDIAVLSTFRGHGIGAQIVRELIAVLRSRGVDWIALIATPGHEAFYRQFGFHAMSGYTPMKLEGGEP